MCHGTRVTHLAAPFMPLKFYRPPRVRFQSLDVFRGLAIAAMVLVNNPGSWEAVYPPLLHAEWHGFTPTDLVFPSFLWIVGTSLAFSLGRDAETGHAPIQIYGRILRRCLILFALGLLLNGFPTYDWPNLRIMGVLQRISLAYGAAAIAIIHLKRIQQIILAAALLVGYWLAMVLIPVPGFGAGQLTQEGNFGAWIDRLLLTPAHLYQGGPFDPEGLFSTLPAIVTVLLGYWVGHWVIRQPKQTYTTILMAIAGAIAIAVGWLWGLAFPLNKALWTSSYVLYAGGWSIVLFALCYELIEVRRWRSLGWPFEVLGLNAITLFVGSGLVARILYRVPLGSGETATTAYNWIYQTLWASWAGPQVGSLLFAIGTVAVWWLVAWVLYRQRWFLKV